MIVIVFFSILLSEEPIEARANKIVEDKLSLHNTLTREERDEYMLYLRSLNAETKDSIYSIELP
tara:strand:+ start:646 stop:837 length:192 start_codon:yes stop_codon:yes gene_type:complete